MVTLVLHEKLILSQFKTTGAAELGDILRVMKSRADNNQPYGDHGKKEEETKPAEESKAEGEPTIKEEDEEGVE